MTDDVRYATAPDGARIAYRLAGVGPIDLLVVGSHGAVFSIECASEMPRLRRFEESLARFCRLITFDLRGFGLSDPLGNDWPLDQRLGDILAVLDACDSEQPALFGAGWGGGMSIEFAYAHPDRVHSVILLNAWCRTLWAEDFPVGLSAEEFDEYGVDGFDPNDDSSDIDLLAPSLAHDPAMRRWWARESRRGARPVSAHAAWTWSRDIDVRPELQQLDHPLLVMEAEDNELINEEAGVWIAKLARDSQYVSIPGADHLAWTLPLDAVIGPIEEFLVGTTVHRAGDGVVRAILFTDIVDSTQHNVGVGDDRWVELLAAHDIAAEQQVERMGGTVVKSMGDGVLATFATPSAALSAARGIIQAAGEIGLSVRSAAHVAEVHERDGDVHGLGVTIAARALAEADGGEIIVTSTVRDLLDGSGHRFDSQGTFDLKGLDRPWELVRLRK